MREGYLDYSDDKFYVVVDGTFLLELTIGLNIDVLDLEYGWISGVVKLNKYTTTKEYYIWNKQQNNRKLFVGDKIRIY